MLDNLKLVLLEHKKFLAIFLFIVFVPSVILAFFGIQAINNERYKLQQLSLEQQRGFTQALKAEIQSSIEKDRLGLRELSASRALAEQDFKTFSKAVSERLQEGAVLGQIVIWSKESQVWFPGLAARPPAHQQSPVPAEWRMLQPDLESAERSEFRARDLPLAISLYRQMLQRAKDDRVRSWILSRIARCEVKRNNYTEALQIHQSLIEDFPDFSTESGRPLEIATRTERLDALLAENTLADFFQESLQALKRIDEIFWSLDGSQAQMYTAILLEKVEKAMCEYSTSQTLENFQSSLKAIQNSLNEKLETWRMADAVKTNLLPDIRERIENSSRDSPEFRRTVLEYEGRDVLLLVLPLDSQVPGYDFEFLGTILEFEHLRETIDTFIKANAPQGVSVFFRSNLSDRVLYGNGTFADQIPVLTDLFPENFPPWKVEVYQEEGIALGSPLYKNIFFWIILALMAIVFIGSGLIIRTIVREVSLLNLKSEFIASVSHEFKTPLTAMGAILERLLNDDVKDPRKIREYHRILSHDSEKLKMLVKNILDFSKIEDRKREYKLIETDITRLVRMEVDSFLRENRLAGFEVETTIADDIPTVLADEEAMSQALHNVLDNAAKFSGRNKKIDIEVIRHNDGVEIAFQDRGIGIPESEQKKVFDKFYRGKQASSVSPTGTGLGLTLVKHILDGHGGRVVIQSQPEKGSRVSLILPLPKGG